LSKLNYYIEKLNGIAGFGPIAGTWKTSLNIDNFNPEVSNATGRYLDSLDRQFRKVRNKNKVRKDSVSNSLIERIGSDAFIKLKDDYSNNQLENVVLDRLRVERSIETDNRIIQKYEPGYMIPLSKSGRAHFYAPYKLIGSIKVDTYWFNLIVLWLAALGWYIALYFNLLQKLVGFIENVRIKNPEK
jgi:hypothetical protein